MLSCFRMTTDFYDVLLVYVRNIFEGIDIPSQRLEKLIFYNLGSWSDLDFNPDLPNGSHAAPIRPNHKQIWLKL